MRQGEKEERQKSERKWHEEVSVMRGGVKKGDRAKAKEMREEKRRRRREKERRYLEG